MDADSRAFEEVPPDPAGTIESLTALGYTPGAAVADIVDNSIAAGANVIDITFHWGGADGSTVVISDDGSGMDEPALRLAMMLGGRGPSIDRDRRDLGRFGLGLKTASFSQCRQLIVASRPRNSARWSSRTWDLDEVASSRQWRLMLQEPDGSTDVLERSTAKMKRGTVVIWRKLTRLAPPGSLPGDDWAHKRFLDAIGDVERHLSMTFSRYLSRARGRVRMNINGQQLSAWDPFLSRHAATQIVGEEELPVQRDRIAVRSYVLPHRSRLSDAEFTVAAGPRGWLEQQGLYVFRNDRLIVAGDWLGLGFRKDDAHILARIEVDVPASLDRAWSVDVKKSTAHPPAATVEPLRRIAKVTRERAGQVLRHRGKVVRRAPRSSELEFVWNVVRRHGRSAVRLNREHPLVGAVLASTERKDIVYALLTLIDETVPTVGVGLEPVAEGAEEYVPFDGVPDEAVKVARAIFEAMLNNGLTPKKAAERLLQMPPFDQYPGVIDELGSI